MAKNGKTRNGGKGSGWTNWNDWVKSISGDKAEEVTETFEMGQQVEEITTEDNQDYWLEEIIYETEEKKYYSGKTPMIKGMRKGADVKFDNSTKAPANPETGKKPKSKREKSHEGFLKGLSPKQVQKIWDAKKSLWREKCEKGVDAEQLKDQIEVEEDFGTLDGEFLTLAEKEAAEKAAAEAARKFEIRSAAAKKAAQTRQARQEAKDREYAEFCHPGHPANNGKNK